MGHCLFEKLFVIDNDIRRRSRHYGIGISFQQCVGGVGDTWCGTSRIRLQKEIFFREFRNLLVDDTLEFAQCDYQDVLFRYYSEASFVSHSYQ